MWWTSSSGEIELNIPKNQAAACSHSGPCDWDVLILSRVPAIRRQLAKITPATLSTVLKEYGAWDEAARADHAQNIQRVLWIACGDIHEENI